MTFNTYGNRENPRLMLIPGLGVSCEIFLPLIDLLKDVYTQKLESIHGADIHFWYGTKEAFVAKPQVEHLCAIHPDTHVEVFQGMNHGQFLVDHPEEVARRILSL